MAARTTRTRSSVPTVYGTSTDVGNNITADTVHAADLSAAVEAVSGRSLVRSVTRSIRGQIAILINPTAANTFTRTRVAAGIAWANSDLVTDQTVSANYPNPLLDEYDWVWRRHWMINYYPTAAGIGSGIRDYDGLAFVRTKAMRKQPSSKHQLFLFTAYDDSSDANIGTVYVAYSLSVGLKDS